MISPVSTGSRSHLPSAVINLTPSAADYPHVGVPCNPARDSSVNLLQDRIISDPWEGYPAVSLLRFLHKLGHPRRFSRLPRFSADGRFGPPGLVSKYSDVTGFLPGGLPLLLEQIKDWRVLRLVYTHVLFLPETSLPMLVRRWLKLFCVASPVTTRWNSSRDLWFGYLFSPFQLGLQYGYRVALFKP